VTVFTGDYAVEIMVDGGIPLPQVWWLATLASDPISDPGPHLMLARSEPRSETFKLYTLEDFSRITDGIRRLCKADPRRIVLEQMAYTNAQIVPIPPTGILPATPTMDRVVGLRAGCIARLQGQPRGFTLRPYG